MCNLTNFIAVRACHACDHLLYLLRLTLEAVPLLSFHLLYYRMKISGDPASSIGSVNDSHLTSTKELFHLELYRAIQHNDTSKAISILSHHNEDSLCDFSDPSNASKWSMLHWASYHGNEDVVKALLNCSAASHRTMLEKNMTFARFIKSPLHLAAQHGQLQVAWLLLLSSFSVHEVDNLGNTPLHLSSAAGHIRLVKCFLNDGADVFARNRFHNTPYDVAKTRECRSLLKDVMEQQREPLAVSESQAQHQRHMESYAQCQKALLIAIESIDHSEEQSLPKLRYLVQQSTDVGIATETVALGQELIRWIELRDELRQSIFIVKQTMPIVSKATYACIRQLREVIGKCQIISARLRTEAEKRRPLQLLLALASRVESIDIDSMIQEGLQLCKKSRLEYLLNAQFIRVLNRPLSTNTTELSCFKEDAALLQKRIMLAMSSDASPQIVEKATSLYDQRAGEMDLVLNCIKKDAWPGVFQNTQVTGRNKSEEKEDKPIITDVGHLEQSEEYLDTSTRAQIYVWIPSKTLTQLRAAIHKARESVDFAENHYSNPEMLEISKRIILEKVNLETLLVARDEEDKTHAILEAKKASNKKKKASNASKL